MDPVKYFFYASTPERAAGVRRFFVFLGDDFGALKYSYSYCSVGEVFRFEFLLKF